MADITPRIAPATLNLAIAAATVIDASSYETSFPPAYLRSATPSKAWRSKLGWNIVTGWNDTINFNRGGVLAATVAAGNYPTGALLAAAIVTALEAADAAPVWACSYNTSTKVFTISSDMAFTLLFGTGANVWSATVGNIGSDLGFAIADTGSAVTHTGGSATYKSREWVRFDFGAASAYTLGIAHDHNLGSSHTVKLLGKTANSTVWNTPGDTQTLVGDDLTNKRILFFASTTWRYTLLLFDDIGNSAGFTECGIPFIGTYFQPARGFRLKRTRTVVPLAQVIRADQGAVQVLPKPGPETHSLEWVDMTRSDFLTWRAYEVSRTRLFLAFDPLNYSGTETLYGVLEQTTPFAQDVADYWIGGTTVFAEDQG